MDKIFTNFPIFLNFSLMSKIGELCLSFFCKSMPAKGKPKPGAEWTVYSAIVQEAGSDMAVVAAGTGSKVSY